MLSVILCMLFSRRGVFYQEHKFYSKNVISPSAFEINLYIKLLMAAPLPTQHFLFRDSIHICIDPLTRRDVYIQYPQYIVLNFSISLHVKAGFQLLYVYIFGNAYLNTLYNLLSKLTEKSAQNLSTFWTHTFGWGAFILLEYMLSKYYYCARTKLGYRRGQMQLKLFLIRFLLKFAELPPKIAFQFVKNLYYFTTVHILKTVTNAYSFLYPVLLI